MEHGPDVSPYQAVKQGRAPYRGIGHAGVVRDWPWCPRWFASRMDGEAWGSWTTIDDVPTLIYIEKAYEFFSRGMLRDLVKPPWTKALIDLLVFYEQLEKATKAQRDREQARTEAEEKQHLINMFAGRG